ncbi:MAG TPA: DUF885 domain-containing protein [Nevskiaceae bacterium]|nr:DUF885 domain-containing protein [Nevskiaceae bacterium]
MPPPPAASGGAVPATAPVASAQDAAFAALSERWLDGWLRRDPVAATQIGDHRFDREVDDLSAAGRADKVAFSRAVLAELDTLDASKLSRQNQVDARILRNQLRGDIWFAETFQSWAWDPQVYNDLAGGALYNLMAREFAPLPDRLRSATARMRKIPSILAQARANLDPARVPPIHAQTVAEQNRGVAGLIELFITPNLGQLHGAERAELEAAATALRGAVAEHQKWLETQLVPQARGDFRIGRKLYDEKLALALNSTLSREEIRRRAESELERVSVQMYGHARDVLRDRRDAPALPDAPTEAQRTAAIAAALELAYADKPARDQVVAASEAALAEATAFTRQHDLVTVPDDPVRIILMPEFQRGVNVAYCDSPGPLDVGQATFFAISPIPDAWTDAQVDSFLREYNARMIHLLAIHEAMPGHYLEGAHSARFPSKLRAVLRSGVFAEGWAVYTEHVMAEAGYHADDPLFRLVQLKFYLRTIANAILDSGVHVDGWTREQALDLMVRRTFQQQREAEGKWKRAQLTSAQLPTYFVGVQEQLEMRKAAEAKLGPGFQAKAYHDAVLAHGGPPVRYVRQLLLDEPIQ